jgi:hypothetical protein
MGEDLKYMIKGAIINANKLNLGLIKLIKNKVIRVIAPFGICCYPNQE